MFIKIVRHNINGEYVSYIDVEHHLHYYIDGMKTIPIFGRIFVFDTLANAFSFLDNEFSQKVERLFVGSFGAVVGPSIEVWEVHTGLVYEEIYCAKYSMAHKMWWDELFDRSLIDDAITPRGTYTTSWVILHRCIARYLPVTGRVEILSNIGS